MRIPLSRNPSRSFYNLSRGRDGISIYLERLVRVENGACKPSEIVEPRSNRNIVQVIDQMI